MKPIRSESVNFDDSENIIIEGDNLEALKLLQKSYLCSVKLIYIDPPYNTGNDFIYPDDYSETLETYLRYTGQLDNEGRKYSSNSETDGRFHSKWLTMMYPRLFLARNLLREDGVVLVSIDDSEVHNLRCIMDMVFGEENFIGSFVWQGGRKNDARLISQSHDYILVYARNQSLLRENDTRWREKKDGLEPIYNRVKELRSQFGNDFGTMHGELLKWFRDLPDGHPSKAHDHFSFVDKRGVYYPDNLRSPNPRPNLVYDWKGYKPHPNGWAYGPDRMAELDAEDRLVYPESKDQRIKIKSYLHEHEEWAPSSVFYKDRRASSKALSRLMGQDVFDFPKDVDVLARLIETITDPDDIVLDFFAGSGTTGQAVMELNAKNGGRRKFILVQLPEPVEIQGFQTIADVVKERLRKVVGRLAEQAGNQLSLAGPTRTEKPGFRVFKLAKSNFLPWVSPSTSDHELQAQLALHVTNIGPDSTQDDLLYEILLKSGFRLSCKVEKITVEECVVHSVSDGALLICLESAISKELIRRIADLQPVRVVFIDRSFAGNDQLKVNAVETFKAKGITFKTV